MQTLTPQAAQANDPSKSALMRKDAGLVFGLLSAVLGASVLLPLPAADGRIAHIPAFCPFYRLTGLPCPGCGLTRAFVCIGHGQFAQSVHWHPIGLLVYAVFVLLWVRAGLTFALGQPALPLSPRARTGLGAIGLAVFLVVGVARITWLLVHHVHYV